MGKRVMWLLGAGASVMLAGYSLAAMGCSNATPEQRPPVTELKEGINLLDVHDAAWGVNAAFVKAGRVIYLETRVGALKPDIYRQSWPDDPKNENDYRFVDQNGHTFYAVRGGDNFADPVWAQQIATERGQTPTPSAERELDFQMAKEAAHAFAAAAPPGFQDHVHPMALFAKQLVPSEDPVMIAKAAQIAAMPRPEAAYGNTGVTNPHYLETDKYSGSTGCFAWICVARHSSTNMWTYTSGWSAAVVANNHGRAPNQLGYDCYSSGGWYYYYATLSGSTAGSNTGNNDGMGGCQTQYAWDSGGYDHECNDDAAYELWQAKSGDMNTSQGGNISFKWYNGNYFACQCNSFNGCTGDWKSPTCP